jgi:hypothetical protein
MTRDMELIRKIFAEIQSRNDVRPTSVVVVHRLRQQQDLRTFKIQKCVS